MCIRFADGIVENYGTVGDSYRSGIRQTAAVCRAEIGDACSVVADCRSLNIKSSRIGNSAAAGNSAGRSRINRRVVADRAV